ncbi:hypothetical protein LN461_18940 [Xanthomonas arboricola]|uniref:hypothetical protein n=1 Tax=Xanthomonas arboricola TaxID=56448 RepID=UPI001E29E56F|nr:hypothetical protein [Xanthomonas arboricola]MCC8671413.1 hypothetical protein [Xanthomonas arboricola]
MTSLADITNSINEISDQDVREAAACLVKQLSNFISDHDASWTISELSKIAGISPDDSVLFESVRLLASKPKTKLLDMHFIYFSAGDEDGVGELLDDSEVMAAYKDGYLIDPQNGSQVHHFERNLVPYFKINEAVSSS